MKVLLDTNVCIHFMNGTSKNIKEKIFNSLNLDIYLCSIVKAELYYGALKSNMVEKNIKRLDDFVSYFSSYHFDDSCVPEYGKIRATLSKKGMLIGPYDMQIASIAISNNLTLVTHNIREFSRIDGLLLEDWE